MPKEEKRVVVVNNLQSDNVEEAILILKSTAKPFDIVNEAQYIIKRYVDGNYITMPRNRSDSQLDNALLTVFISLCILSVCMLAFILLR